MSQDEAWQALYAKLQACLAGHGNEDPYGNGDFWLVDDDWGGPQHKVCVFRLGFLTPALCAEVQRMLGGFPPTWQVLFALDTPNVHRHAEDLGVSVTKFGIAEQWSRVRMSQTFGDEFKWRGILLPFAADDDGGYERFLCMDCGKDTYASQEYYMLLDETWRSINPEIDGMLCLDCAERRLGRELNAADFNVQPTNQRQAACCPALALRLNRT
jgi:hypothetical protein